LLAETLPDSSTAENARHAKARDVAHLAVGQDDENRINRQGSVTLHPMIKIGLTRREATQFSRQTPATTPDMQ